MGTQTSENQQSPDRERAQQRGLSLRVKKILSVVLFAIAGLWIFAIGYSIWRANTPASGDFIAGVSPSTLETAYQCMLHWELYIETKRDSPNQVHIENLARAIRERGLAVVRTFDAGSTQEMLYVCEGQLEQLWSLLSGSEQSRFPNVIELLYYRDRLEYELRDYDP